MQRQSPALIVFAFAVSFLVAGCATNFLKKGNPGLALKDKDGNGYTSKIMLDNKQWMTDNLRINIPGSYCYEDKTENCDQYGRLYTWEAAQRGCAVLGEGWRLPTNAEWQQMAKHYGGVRDDSDDSGKAAYKAMSDGGSAGFNILLGGGRDPDGNYKRGAAHGFYWTATAHDTGRAWFYNFGKGGQMLNRHDDGEKSEAFSVRCIRDVQK